jgi:hypothetical protein
MTLQTSPQIDYMQFPMCIARERHIRQQRARMRLPPRAHGKREQRAGEREQQCEGEQWSEDCHT